MSITEIKTQINNFIFSFDGASFKKYLGRILRFQGTFGGIITQVAMLLSGRLLQIIVPYVLPLVSVVIYIVLVIVTCSKKIIKDI